MACLSKYLPVTSLKQYHETSGFPNILYKWWELYQQWRWVNTYGLIVGMNMYKNPVFLRYQRFDPQPHIWAQQGTWPSFSACYNWNRSAMGYGMRQVFSVEFLRLMSCSIFHGGLLLQSQFIHGFIHVVWGIDDRIQVRISCNVVIWRLH